MSDVALSTALVATITAVFGILVYRGVLEILRRLDRLEALLRPKDPRGDPKHLPSKPWDLSI